ncbi:PREDICTED: pentatricopeptide repeat-containing protein At1g08070, chloroplastic-like [Nelumbo nucifera]|uniref:Pentatricopeptide repeat-containing protein At1g08070, chloroplastic-like n=2 Tax=Nelumbo nucifera TaxID=4432 RepID=A0A1U8BEA4_NELNU|nr:PREDICTED: pentatricopeptide repeat-containing protein At1g08070, chloroplastic-like [Nelumbo nucifera]DAD20859.1 TPA_asm: hypothetical protein HUJ06_022322 [Nelumbo nucifera]
MLLIFNTLLNIRHLTIAPSHVSNSNIRPTCPGGNLHTRSVVNNLPPFASGRPPLVVEEPHPATSFFVEGRSNRYTVQEAKQLHSYIVKLGSSNIYFINSLIHVYAINGALGDARKLFDETPHRDVVSWTTLVDGYAKFGKMHDAKELFDSMPMRNVVSWNVMISGYGKQGDVEAAVGQFNEMPERDIVSWNSLITSYTRNGFSEKALETFIDALNQTALIPNKVTFLSILPAIADLGCALLGRCVHSFILKAGIEVDGLLSSALVDMYSKCDCLEQAVHVFESNPSRANVASWNPLFAGLVRKSIFEDALDLFRTMQSENVEPDYVTIVTVLPAIADLGAIGLGKWIHTYAKRRKIGMNATLNSALIDMYSKCGCIELAQQVFTMAEDKTVELWNAMIAGLAINGRGKDAIKLFSQMQAENLEFDDITLASVLNACSHSGLIDEGLGFYAAMKDVYGMTPKLQHYGCIVDLLGRAGRLEEAKKVICSDMDIKPDDVIWKSLLGACKIHGHVEIGEFAARKLIEINPNDSSTYVLMSSIYDAVGRSRDAVMIRKMMNDGKVRKEPGFSFIELGGTVHEFLVGDRSHPRMEEIHNMLNEIADKLKSMGYVPQKKLVLFDMDDEEKEVAIYHHSEKLAIAFGLINSLHGTPLHVVKNLRMCSDCHVFMKMVSKIYNREIVVRDQRRFHHFRSGRCSCMDYW